RRHSTLGAAYRLARHQLGVLEFARVFAGVSRHNLAAADELVLVNQQAFDAYGSAGVRFIRADPDLRAEAVAESIREARGCIPEHAGGIDCVQELLRRLPVFSDDGVGMSGAITMDMLDRIRHIVDSVYRHRQIQKFDSEVFLYP